MSPFVQQILLVGAVSALWDPRGVSPSLLRQQSFSSKPKHVVFVIADDSGFADYGFHNSTPGGNLVYTPNIDEVARTGLRLARLQTEPVCSPTRTSMYTGRFPMRYGLLHHVYTTNSDCGLPENETMIANAASAAGFHTAMVGKWHCGSSRWGMIPVERGIDQFYGFLSGAEDHFTHTINVDGDTCVDLRNGSLGLTTEKGEYSANIYTDAAIRAIHDYSSSGKDGGLFLVVAFQNCHDPNQATDWYLDPLKPLIKDQRRLVFAAMMAALDDGVGNITKALEAASMLQDTLFAFQLSDNNSPAGPTFAVNGGANSPLRGSKHTRWNGGLQSSAVLYGAGVARRNATDFHLLHATDWYVYLWGRD